MISGEDQITILPQPLESGTGNPDLLIRAQQRHHGGWERGGDHCHFCNTTWGHLLVGLKDYAERGVKNPYFK